MRILLVAYGDVKFDYENIFKVLDECVSESRDTRNADSYNFNYHDYVQDCLCDSCEFEDKDNKVRIYLADGESIIEIDGIERGRFKILN